MKPQETLENLEKEIITQEHINKSALQAILHRHLEESKEHLAERQEFYEGKIAAYQEILHLLASDSEVV